MRSQITENVVNEINSNPVVSRWIKKDKVEAITASYLNSLSDNQLIQKSTTDELAAELIFMIKAEIRNSNPPVKSDEFEATLNEWIPTLELGLQMGSAQLQ